MAIIFKRGNMAQELSQVHDKMIAAYDKRQYSTDVQRAQQMENILRKLKATKITDDNNSNNLESIFDQQCYQIADMALKNIQTVSNSDKLHAKRLFATTHSAGYELGKSMDVDDIVEAELASVLQSIQSLGLSDIEINNLDFLSNTTGRIKGNLATEGQKLISNITGEIVEETVNKIQNTNFRNKSYQKIAARLKDTQAKSIKTDVQSFNVELVADLKPEWEQFSVFAGANFTIKNYLSKRKDGRAIQIHLGETNPYKSVLAQLDYLGYPYEEGRHIFFHSLNSWLQRRTKAVEVHIPHIRFAYELQGNGLYDEDGASLSGADFLIVNDPISENIYVRSTKALIAHALQKSDQDPEPFTSNQYILYTDLMNGLGT